MRDDRMIVSSGAAAQALVLTKIVLSAVTACQCRPGAVVAMRYSSGGGCYCSLLPVQGDCGSAAVQISRLTNSPPVTLRITEKVYYAISSIHIWEGSLGLDVPRLYLSASA